MRISVETELSLEKIQEIVNEEKCGIMITGGEPTFDENLNNVINLINKIDCNLFNVETNGYNLLSLIERVNPNKNVHYSLSPKLFTKEDFEFYADLIKKIKHNVTVFLKIVYEEDKPIIITFLNFLQSINFDNQRIFFMPEGKTKDEILNHASIVFDAAERYKVNFSSREHIIYSFI
jgi:molybdenum cofactor biosynthesis enzyme MoaA